MDDHFRDDVQLTMKIFDTVIAPILTYGSEVWGVDHDEKLEKDPIALRTDDVTKMWPAPRLRQTLAISARGRKNAVWKRTVCDQFCLPF